MIIEAAQARDLPAILAILNHYVVHDHCVFDTEPWTQQAKQPWFDGYGSQPRHQLLVAREADKILGYTHSGQWRAKRAYDVTVETTIYVAPDAAGRGLGRALLGTLLERLEGTGARRAVAGVAQPNEPSNRLHESLGYQTVGTFHGCGYKFDQAWDVRWYERAID